MSEIYHFVLRAEAGDPLSDLPTETPTEPLRNLPHNILRRAQPALGGGPLWNRRRRERFERLARPTDGIRRPERSL